MTKEAEKEISVKEGINAPVKMNVTDAALSKLQKKYEKIPDITTKEGYEFVRVGLGELRTLRTGAGKHKATLKAEAIAYNKRVDVEYNRVLAAIFVMEEPMKAAKDAEDAAKEKIREAKAEKEKERVAAIEKDINTIRNVVLDCHGKTSLELSGIISSLDATVIEVDRFAEHTPIAEAAKIEALERLTELKEQALETEKAAIEQAVKKERLDKEREAFEAEKKETKRIDDIKFKIQAIKDRGAYNPDATAVQLEGRINVLKNLVPNKEVYEEFTEDAFMAIGLAVAALQDFYVIAVEKERIAAATAQEIADRAVEDALALESDLLAGAPDAEEKVEEPALNDDDVVDAEFVPEEHAPSDDDENRIEFVNALVDICPAIPTPTANHIYRAIRDGRLPHVQLVS